jgi:hypothetical protein
MDFDFSKVWAILGPLLNLLKSRKFITAVAGILAMVLVTLVPELQQYNDVLIQAIVAVIIAVIGGTALEDAAAKLNRK